MSHMPPPPQSVQMIAIAEINILNPRVRNRRIFQDITNNISNVGIKKPITVTRSQQVSATGKPYDLVCGQGRLEAYLACQQTHIPALVIEASEEQALVMSLVENLARRQHRSIDLLQGIKELQQQGYEPTVIADKVGLSPEYVGMLLKLLDQGEERLLVAVDNGTMPISVAMDIANANGNEQQALQEAYENKLLRGQKLFMAKRLVESRRLRGKQMLRRINRSSVPSKLSAKDLVNAYQKEVDRKRLLVRKAELASQRLMFATQALRQLLRNDAFLNLLQSEGLSTLPQSLAHLIQAKG
jgi:ParB family transcriptional regulator, chromosome partitioning protein